MGKNIFGAKLEFQYALKSNNMYFEYTRNQHKKYVSQHAIDSERGIQLIDQLVIEFNLQVFFFHCFIVDLMTGDPLSRSLNAYREPQYPNMIATCSIVYKNRALTNQRRGFKAKNQITCKDCPSSTLPAES